MSNNSELKLRETSIERTSTYIKEVDKNNSNNIYTEILFALNNASYVAIDLEMSGIGESVGISIWRKSNQIAQLFEVYNYSLTCCPTTNFTISPESASFLIKNGFDLNSPFKKGIPFIPCGLPREEQSGNKEMVPQCVLQEIFRAISASNTPIILHNGLMDALFICFNFFCQLPDNLPDFCVLFTTFFPIIYDTKEIAWVEELNSNIKETITWLEQFSFFGLNI
ncbi:MAG: putative target of EGR1 protein 1 [Streblomastix strix]|uniref:Putative target of EGR1 protein 1 n=1 Tax=Streblomastix strix TaxID=222440 RepID=A0A5J4VBR6_9EUKA|nr:MAG: putative target of EGR1 protein 1 [Streblomastix strix]